MKQKGRDPGLSGLSTLNPCSLISARLPLHAPQPIDSDSDSDSRRASMPQSLTFESKFDEADKIEALRTWVLHPPPMGIVGVAKRLHEK